MAAAEAAIDDQGARVTWDHDQLPWDPGDTDYQPKEVLCAVLRDRDGKVLSSLCGIADPDRNYGRVIEAELADEAFADLLPDRFSKTRKRR